MSTKCSLKYGDGFHLYCDVMDSIGPNDTWLEHTPVYLEISGGSVELYASAEKGNTVTVGIPRDIAIALGLVAPEQTKPEGNPSHA